MYRRQYPKKLLFFILQVWHWKLCSIGQLSGHEYRILKELKSFSFSPPWEKNCLSKSEESPAKNPAPSPKKPNEERMWNYFSQEAMKTFSPWQTAIHHLGRPFFKRFKKGEKDCLFCLYLTPFNQDRNANPSQTNSIVPHINLIASKLCVKSRFSML